MKGATDTLWYIIRLNKCGIANMSTKKSKESEESKENENIEELPPARVMIQNNNHEKPKRWKGPATDQDRKIVYTLAAYGATNEDMAAVLGMDNKTLTLYFPEEINTGRSTAKNMIAQRLYNLAVGKPAVHEEVAGVAVCREAEIKPSLSALIFLAKVRLGWKETQVVETHNMKSGVQIYLPDNGMRSEEDKDE